MNLIAYNSKRLSFWERFYLEKKSSNKFSTTDRIQE